MSSAVSVVRAGIFKDGSVRCHGMWGVFIVLIYAHVLRTDAGRFDKKAAGSGSGIDLSHVITSAALWLLSKTPGSAVER